MHATLRRLYTDERKRTMELVSKRIWGFPLMDRKCNTEELSSTRIKTIVFQFIFVFKFCLPERLLTFMVSSHPATLPPCYPATLGVKDVFPACWYVSPERRSAKRRVKTYTNKCLWDYNDVPRLCALSDFGTFMPWNRLFWNHLKYRWICLHIW